MSSVKGGVELATRLIISITTLNQTMVGGAGVNSLRQHGGLFTLGVHRHSIILCLFLI